MGSGLPPGTRTGLNDAGAIDDGTQARMGSPAPGSVGVDAKGTGPGTSGASIAEGVVGFAARRLGQRVGGGECFALADRALRTAGAKIAADFGPVTPDADYVWGTAVNLSEVRPGDVVQFRAYSCRRVVVTESDEGTRTEERLDERPHHTAVVERVAADGALTVLEQNSPPGSAVARTVLFFADGRAASGRQTTTVTVEGSCRFYRPQPR